MIRLVLHLSLSVRHFLLFTRTDWFGHRFRNTGHKQDSDEYVCEITPTSCSLPHSAGAGSGSDGISLGSVVAVAVAAWRPASVVCAAFASLAGSPWLNFFRLWQTEDEGESESKEPRGKSGSSVPETEPRIFHFSKY